MLNLVENVLVGQTVESRARRIEEILLLRADVRRAFDALNDADPATMKAIADWLTGVLMNYRRTDVALDFPDFPTLQPTLSTYRPLIIKTFSNIQLQFGSMESSSICFSTTLVRKFATMMSATVICARFAE